MGGLENNINVKPESNENLVDQKETITKGVKEASAQLQGELFSLSDDPRDEEVVRKTQEKITPTPTHKDNVEPDTSSKAKIEF